MNLPPTEAPALIDRPRRFQRHWIARHKAKLAEIASRPVDLLLCGDSNMQSLESDDPEHGCRLEIWERYFAPRNAVNLGFRGDTAHDLLWRIENGEVDGIDPRLAIVMIGTNRERSKQSQVEITHEGIVAVIAALHERLPAARFLLLGIPPRNDTRRREAERLQINTLSAERDWTEAVTFVSTDAVLMRGGAPDPDLYVNGDIGKTVHLNVAGWRRLADHIEPIVAEAMNTSS